MSTPDDREQPQRPEHPGQGGQYPQYPGGSSGSFVAPPPGAGYGQPTAAPRNGFGITALVLGILALVFCWTVIGGIVLGVIALVLGILGVKRANRREATNKGVAVSGIVTGSIGLVIGALFAIVFGSIFAIFGNQIGDLQDCVQQAGGDQAKVQQCQQQFSDDVQQQR
ncbi:DUF4190 domain-containing protein [Amycolatopsis jiangsuensis]|uniref:DUF4190 domain-containing protein n=1 Tax=Amycolatopsis jiangsuensis TaxID=1181879 RepID=A0A840IU26_9PSEU|nr:DUF4190 domain-containing protein [Amycolatopsis jiangsuensis]MBB4684484.1 hypothetical protein [Amycolatopsis jiangsuensis]